MAETQKTNALLALTQRQLPTVWLFKVNDRRRKGLPDVLAVFNCRSFAIEFKELARGDNLAAVLRRDTRWPLQREELLALRRAGAHAYLGVLTTGKSEIDFYTPDLTMFASAPSLAQFLQSESRR